jgi:hypothetical protein
MSLDLVGFINPMFAQASNLFDRLIPIFAIVIGISLAIVLIVLVVNAIRSIVPHQ